MSSTNSEHAGVPRSATVFLPNPQARSAKGGDQQQAVLAELERRDIDLRVEVTDSATGLRAAAKRAAENEERVIVVGGDGTIHHAVNAVAKTTTVLGVVAAGTGNDFARAMCLPVLSPSMRAAKTREIVTAAVTACLSPPVSVDAIAITALNGVDTPNTADTLNTADTPNTTKASEITWCASIATCGFTVDVDCYAAQMTWPRGPLKYTVASLVEARRLRIRRYTITVDGKHHELEAAILAFANTESFGGGYCIAPEASPNDGLIDVIVVGRLQRTTLLRLMPATRSGRHISHTSVTRLRGKVIEIRQLPGSGGDSLRADGEQIGVLPRRLEVVPGALHIAGASPKACEATQQ